MTRTLRLEKIVDDSLKTIADREGTSVNVVATKALVRLVDFGHLALRFGYQGYPESVMVKILDAIGDEKTVVDLGRWDGKNSAREFAHILFRETSVEATVRLLKYLDQHANRFRFDMIDDGRKKRILLRHNMSKKWSLYYEGLVRALLEEIPGVRDLDLESTSDQVLAEFSTDVGIASNLAGGRR